MTLIQSWADSLTLLKPKNFQLFAMVTLKSIIEAYKTLLYHFWWIIVLIVACTIAPYFFSYHKIIVFISCWLYELLFLAACFSTRPSMLQKDRQYFIHQFKKIILFWLFMPLFSWSSATYYGYIFTVLFFADSDGGPKNFLLPLWNAIKMIFVNLPLMIILGGIIYASGWIGGLYLLRLLAMTTYMHYALLFNMVGALLLPIGVCIYVNIYIKRLHDQFELYFNKAQ